MHVCELLLEAQASNACPPPTCLALLRHAEMRGVKDARAFLLQLPGWDVCHSSTVWALRCVHNRTSPQAKLWVPLTFTLPLTQASVDMKSSSTS